MGSQGLPAGEGIWDKAMSCGGGRVGEEALHNPLRMGLRGREDEQREVCCRARDDTGELDLEERTTD